MHHAAQIGLHSPVSWWKYQNCLTRPDRRQHLRAACMSMGGQVDTKEDRQSETITGSGGAVERRQTVYSVSHTKCITCTYI